MDFYTYLTTEAGLAESTAKLYESVWRQQKNETDSHKRTLVSVSKHWKRYCKKGYDIRSRPQITSEQKGYDIRSRPQITSEQVAGITRESIQGVIDGVQPDEDRSIDVSNGACTPKANQRITHGIPLVFSDVFPSLTKEGEAAKALQNIIEILKVSNFDDEIKLLFIATIVNNHNKEK